MSLITRCLENYRQRDCSAVARLGLWVRVPDLVCSSSSLLKIIFFTSSYQKKATSLLIKVSLMEQLLKFSVVKETSDVCLQVTERWTFFKNRFLIVFACAFWLLVSLICLKEYNLLVMKEYILLDMAAFEAKVDQKNTRNVAEHRSAYSWSIPFFHCYVYRNRCVLGQELGLFFKKEIPLWLLFN